MISPEAPFQRKISFHLVLIAVVALLAYSNTFHVPFQFDDFENITENAVIHSLDNFLSSSKAYDFNPRRYICNLTFALNYRAGGMNVTGYHIVNLAIHVLNAVLLYFFVILTFRTPGFAGRTMGSASFPVQDPKFMALFASLLFVAHPVQTQAVTYIVQRFTSLATLFYLLSVVSYIKGRLATSNPRHAVPAAWYLLSLVSAVLAMKTKEIAFTLPVAIVLYEFLFFKSGVKTKLLILIPVILVLAIIPLSIMGTGRPLGEILSDLSDRTRIQTDIPRWSYLATEMRVIVTYVRLIFMPVGQNLDYDYPIYHSFLSPPVLFSSLFLLTLFGTAVYLIRRSSPAQEGITIADPETTAGDNSTGDPRFTDPSLRLIAFGILWFFISLSVESSVIPITDVIFEHRLYLPSAGAFAALAAALCWAAGKAGNIWPAGRKALIPFALIIAALTCATWARNTVWKDDLTLWKDVVRKAPGNARAHNNLGFIYSARGMSDRATPHLVTALRLKPDYLDARVNLGIAFNAIGMIDQAMEQFGIVLRMNPDDADAHNNLGISYVNLGKFDEGIRHYQIALKLKPDYPEAYNNLGVAYGNKGMFDEAIGYFRRALALKPDYFEARHNFVLAQEKKAGK